jgi:hypothetical protein
MITITWSQKIINVPKSYLTQTAINIYDMDLNQFKVDLGDIMDSEYGIVNDTIFDNNSPVEIDGVVYARALKIINGYTVTFEDGQYAVNLVGANSNVATVTNVNMVSIRPHNSAGLQIVSVGSGLSQEEHDELFSINDNVDTIPDAVFDTELGC